MKGAYVGWFVVVVLLVSCNSLMGDSYGGLCGSGCSARCSKAGMQDRCLKYCGICCAKCNCVPSGTFGNKHQCPCYRDMVNNKGKPKCP